MDHTDGTKSMSDKFGKTSSEYEVQINMRK